MAQILVVDDMQSELELISHVLLQAGYTVVTANSGQDALDIVNQSQPDAIVTDWMMPEMGGLDLCRKLKRNPNTAKIPVIACTAKDRDVDRMWATKQGVVAYITKPYSKEELLTALQSAMK